MEVFTKGKKGVIKCLPIWWYIFVHGYANKMQIEGDPEISPCRK